MKVYLDGDILHYNDKDYNVSNVPKEVVEYFVRNYNEFIENKLKMKGKLVGLRNNALVYDFGWYKSNCVDPVNTIPRGVWTRHGNIYYNSFLLMQGRREPCAKCLKCGKLVTGTFQELEHHARTCSRRELQDRVDHTWKYYGNLKYHSIESMNNAKDRVK